VLSDFDESIVDTLLLNAVGSALERKKIKLVKLAKEFLKETFRE